jgi:hypothetical protein
MPPRRRDRMIAIISVVSYIIALNIVDPKYSAER